MLAVSGITLLIAATCSGCPFSKSVNNTQNTATANAATNLVTRGKAVYISNCTACHNINPKQAGSLGPDVYGSSKELLTARILHAKYPDGYKPKRSSGAMPALPHLANDIDALAAFLNQQ